jgi:hypothetical protein
MIKSLRIHWKGDYSPLLIENVSSVRRTKPGTYEVVEVQGYPNDYETPSTFTIYEKEVAYIEEWETPSHGTQEQARTV